jgi:hypothetical protein
MRKRKFSFQPYYTDPIIRFSYYRKTPLLNHYWLLTAEEFLSIFAEAGKKINAAVLQELQL